MVKLCANLSFLFTEIGIEDRFIAAGKAGFEAVEWSFPYALSAREIRRCLDAAGLELVMINAPPGDWGVGERGLAALSGREDDFHVAMAQAIDYASVLGCRNIHVMAGVVPAGRDRGQALTILVDNLRRAARACRRCGIDVLIEPINPFDMPDYLLNRAEEAIEIIERVGAKNVRLQYDIYHACRLGVDPLLEIRRFLPAIGHIQIAARDGRGEPDGAEPDAPMIFAQLDRWGYDGWVGLEYTPRGGTAAGLSWARDAGFLPPRG